MSTYQVRGPAGFPTRQSPAKAEPPETGRGKKPGATMFSLSVFNTEDECEHGVNALVEAVRLLREGGACSNA